MAAALDDDFARALRAAWFRFLDGVEPHRQDLHRYCLALTGNLWDAEDLAQDTLLKGYAALGRGDLHGEGSRLRSLKGHLLRIASNLWIDQARRTARAARLEPPAAVAEAAGETRDGVRDAATRLLRDLPPKERASVVLKEVFDLSLEEIGELLPTTPGAVKSALHRARARLSEPTAIERDTPSAALVDRFLAAFDARDAKVLSALLLETVTVEVPGVGGGRGGVQAWVDISIAYPPDRMSVATLHGEVVVLCFDEESGRALLTDVLRLEEVDGRVAKITDYYFAPDTLSAVAGALGVGCKSVGYHQPPETLVEMIATTGAPWIAA
jgi:RNA polymerase sigma-70 factor (ECF subfamily)